MSKNMQQGELWRDPTQGDMWYDIDLERRFGKPIHQGTITIDYIRGDDGITYAKCWGELHRVHESLTSLAGSRETISLYAIAGAPEPGRWVVAAVFAEARFGPRKGRRWTAPTEALCSIYCKDGFGPTMRRLFPDGHYDDVPLL